MSNQTIVVPFLYSHSEQGPAPGQISDTLR